ncbi:MAG: hypothetical protein HKP47_02950, partial [Eudoraea sp.]|nr:hypothetical protein [Eudoraea sp.]
MKRFALILCLLFTTLTIAQEELSLDYYLPQEYTYDPAIPKPADVIGHEVGEWHV